MTTTDVRRGRSGPELGRSLPLREILATPALAGAGLVAGAGGADRLVERLNVMEVPDILPWVKPHELLLTTAYPLRDQLGELPELVRALDRAGVAGLAVKLGRYLDALPDGVLATADELDFPIVLLPGGTSFDEVLNQVLAAILNQHAALLARSEAIHRTFLDLVLAGGGLDAIVARLAEITGGAAAVLDTDRSILARSGDDPRLEDHLDIRGGELLHGDRPVGTAVTVSAGSRVYGHVVAFGDDTDARLALETAATVTALEIVKRNELQAVEAKYQSDLIYDLLVGRARDREEALARAATFGWQLDRRMICLVVQLDDPAGTVASDLDRRRAPLAATISEHILRRDPGAAVVRFSNEVVVLTEAFDGDDGRARAKAFMRQLIRRTVATVGAEVSAGMGRPVTDVQDVPVAYRQATRALAIGRQVDGRGVVAHFDDLGAYRLLSLVPDVEELTSFAHETLGSLTGDDEASADLRHTLEVLLEANCNVAEAARRLHFHYNTLRYRIEKLERIVGPFTLDATTRLDVHLALLVHRMQALSS